eukprot:CAMPEP_0184294124 /NCGR_PEP_ID=MMETSP1049-20130417/5389_1 /TAXON_ID=77928 /ORGANISM="Proteomonas sulcata, Strain CCMP704" /LENGTH=179 /DNA_ID=CAMNT_0026602305 /DNA_START=685 /DNA_END=1224 /DNA_ORIENTATION=-
MDVMCRCPQIFGLRRERLQENVDYFRDGLGIPKKQLVDVIHTFPRSLTYKIDSNLKPKLRFLRTELDFTKEEIREEVIDFPMLMSYSLEKRIESRCIHLRRCGVRIRTCQSEAKKRGRNHKSIKLKSMLLPSDDVFYNRYQEEATVHWLSHGTVKYDPSGVDQPEEEFFLDLGDLHASS